MELSPSQMDGSGDSRRMSVTPSTRRWSSSGIAERYVPMSACERERGETRGAVREGGDVHDIHHLALHATIARRSGGPHQLRVVRLLVAPPVARQNATCEKLSVPTLPCRPGEGAPSIRPYSISPRSSTPNSLRCSQCCRTRTRPIVVYGSPISFALTSSNTNCRVPFPASRGE